MPVEKDRCNDPGEVSEGAVSCRCEYRHSENISIYPKKWEYPSVCLSAAHKIHGPKGVGFLYINSKAKVQPLILGGGQQNGMRSGTDNVPGIAGLGVAAEMMLPETLERERRSICIS